VLGSCEHRCETPVAQKVGEFLATYEQAWKLLSPFNISFKLKIFTHLSGIATGNLQTYAVNFAVLTAQVT
jgi:hypothetical protein